MHVGRWFVAFSRTEPSASMVWVGFMRLNPHNADVRQSHCATAVDRNCLGSMGVASLAADREGECERRC